MAEDQNGIVSEFHRLKTAAAQMRAQAIRSQIASGITFCRIAKTELEYGHAKAAHDLLEKLQKLVQVVRRHLDEPDHVPPSEVEKVRRELAELESRIHAVEQLSSHNR